MAAIIRAFSNVLGRKRNCCKTVPTSSRAFYDFGCSQRSQLRCSMSKKNEPEEMKNELLEKIQEELKDWPPLCKRQWIEIESSFTNDRYLHDNEKPELTDLTILQWNVLADGLSGRSPTRGGFIRAPEEALAWGRRRWRLLEEAVRWGPDLMCLQEVDHFEDWFAPALGRLGYAGLWARKPSAPALRHAAGLEDGCAIFYLKDKLELKWSSSCVFGVWDLDGSHQPTNQVYILAEFATKKDPSRSFLVSTAHLKADKSMQGEQMRAAQARQLLDDVRRRRRPAWPPDAGSAGSGAGEEGEDGGDEAAAAVTAGRPFPGRIVDPLDILLEAPPSEEGGGGGGLLPALVCGDFNAVPAGPSGDGASAATAAAARSYPALCYPLCEGHPAGLYSALQRHEAQLMDPQRRHRQPPSEALEEEAARHSPYPPTQKKDSSVKGDDDDMAVVEPVYTTWKVRPNVDGTERHVKDCLDYLFLSQDVQVQALASLPTLGDGVDPESFCPARSYPSDHFALVARVAF